MIVKGPFAELGKHLSCQLQDIKKKMVKIKNGFAHKALNPLIKF